MHLAFLHGVCVRGSESEWPLHANPSVSLPGLYLISSLFFDGTGDRTQAFSM